MIAAFKFNNFWLATIGPGKPDGIHISLAARGYKPHLFTARHRCTYIFSQIYAASIIGKKCHAFWHLFQNDIKHFWMTMAKQHWPRANQIINIFGAVFVPDMATGTM